MTQVKTEEVRSGEYSQAIFDFLQNLNFSDPEKTEQVGLRGDCLNLESSQAYQLRLSDGKDPVILKIAEFDGKLYARYKNQVVALEKLFERVGRESFSIGKESGCDLHFTDYDLTSEIQKIIFTPQEIRNDRVASLKIQQGAEHIKEVLALDISESGQ